MPETNIKSHCNTCGLETDHIILHKESSQWVDEEMQCDGGTAYLMIKCAGCGTIAMRSEAWHSDFTDEYGAPDLLLNYFPPRSFRKMPSWHSALHNDIPAEKTISDLLKEIYIALQNDQRRLAAMGIRSLLEFIMIDKVGDNKSFTNNLNAFHSAGFISKVQRDVIDAVLEAGHASIHRDFKPGAKTLIQLIDITESLVQVLYIQSHQAAEIKAVTPKRKP